MRPHEQPSFRAARWIARHVAFPLLMRLELRGLEHVPREGAHIVASNHISMVDIPLMMTLLPRRPSILAKAELFKPVIRRFWRWGDAIPVRRGGADRAALRAAQDRLTAGIPFGIFPEGTRIRTGALAEAKAGTGMIALRARAPVVPMAITGSDQVLRGNRPHPFRRPRVVVALGRPISPDELSAAGGAQAVTLLVMRRIAALLPPERRGAYGEAEEAAPEELVTEGAPRA